VEKERKRDANGKREFRTSIVIGACGVGRNKADVWVLRTEEHTEGRS